MEKDMLKKLWDSLDIKYAKICLYTSVTVILTVIVLGLLYATGTFWIRLWSIFTAVLKPIIIGGIISFLLSPIVDSFEEFFNKKKSHGWARYVAIFLSFLLILAAIALIIVILIFAIYRNVSAINLESITELSDSIQSDTKNLFDVIEDHIESMGLSMTSFSGVVTNAAIAIKNFVSGLFFGIIFSIYFMIDGKRIKDYWKRAFSILTSKKDEEKMV